MILPPTLSRPFIRTYQALLDTTTMMLNPEAFVNATSKEDKLRNLQNARESLFSGEVLFEEVLSRTREDGVLLDDEALGAIRRLRLQRWIYLRDTSRGSILLDMEMPASYLVVGLTEPLRTLTGRCSIVLKAAIAPMRDMFFSDGLMATVVYIGPNIRSDYNDKQRRLREQGTYYKRYDENVPHFPILR